MPPTTLSYLHDVALAKPHDVVCVFKANCAIVSGEFFDGPLPSVGPS